MNNNLSIELITNNRAEYKRFTIETLDKISKNLCQYGVNFSYHLDEFIHDRYIKVDDDWKILMGRGLDIYKETKLTEISNYDLKQRNCKKSNITYLPKGSF
jgi:ATP-dependent Lon protease